MKKKQEEGKYAANINAGDIGSPVKTKKVRVVRLATIDTPVTQYAIST